MSNTHPGVSNTRPGVSNTRPGVSNTHPGGGVEQALEAIKKLQSEQKLKIKDLEGDEKTLKLHKEQSRKMRIEKKVPLLLQIPRA